MKTDKLYLSMLVSNIALHDDEKSFSALFKLLYEKLVNFSNHYVQSRELAEEVVSDVFVKLWNNRLDIGSIQSIEAYIYVAVKNQSLNNVKRKPHSFIQIDAFNQFDIGKIVDGFDPERELEVQELVHDIKIAIDSLPAQCKTVFTMIKEDGFKYKEVAEILHISPRTVETQLVRALKRLDLALTPYINKRLKRKAQVKKLGIVIGPALISFMLY